MTEARVAAAASSEPTRWRPGSVLLPGRHAKLATEFFAGLTLAALALPLNIGYAEAAGLPVLLGINAALLPVIVFVLASRSRHLVVGPDATIAALLAATLPGLAAESGELPEELALGVSLLTGIALLVLYAIKAGSMVRFISKAVLVGFLAGLGIEILTSQVEKMMAVPVETGGWLTDVAELVRRIPEASWASVAVGAATIGLMQVSARFAPRLPGALLALGLVTTVVYLLEPDGVAVLGEIPSGLPSLSLPALGAGVWSDLLGVSLAIAVLTTAEGLLVAGSAARRHGDPLDPSSELASMGLANVAASMSSSMPLGASASRSAATEAAGSRSQAAGAVSAVLVLVVVLYLTDLIAEIPSAALAGLVASAVWAIVDVRAFREFAQVRRSEFLIAVGCAAGVLILGPIGGLVLAVVATMLDIVRRLAKSPWVSLQPPPGGDDLRRFVAESDLGPSLAETERIHFVRLPGPLFFANADALRDRIGAAAHDVDWVVLDFEVVPDIDPTAAEALREAATAVLASGKVLATTRMTARMRALVERYGLTDLLSLERDYPTNRAAWHDFRGDSGGRPGAR